jgi:hypothetical protein
MSSSKDNSVDNLDINLTINPEIIKLTNEQQYCKFKTAGIDYAKAAVYKDKIDELNNASILIIDNIKEINASNIDDILKRKAYASYEKMAAIIDEEKK